MQKSESNILAAGRIRERLRSKNLTRMKRESLFPFYLVLLYLFLEYSRPQDLIPFLSVFRLPLITVVLLGLSILFSGKFRLRDKQTLLFMAILGLMVIHGPIAVNNYWALMIFLTMSLNFVVFLSLVHFVDTPEKYERLVRIWLGIHIFLAIVGIVKKGEGIGGFLGDENDFCMTLNMIIPFSFYLSVHAYRGKKIRYILLTCLFLFVVVLTESRGGFVGLSATFLYCWLRTKQKAVTALLVALLAVFAVFVAPSTYWSEVRSITEEGAQTGTGEERVYTWRVGWHMFLDNPVLGVGQGNFPYVFRKYEIEAGFEEGYYGRSVAGRAAHSVYFTVLPELGLVGTFLFLAIIFYNLKDLNQIKNTSLTLDGMEGGNRPSGYYYYALALEGSLITYLVSGAFISVLYYPNLWILMGFIISLKNISHAGTGNDEVAVYAVKSKKTVAAFSGSMKRR